MDGYVVSGTSIVAYRVMCRVRSYSSSYQISSQGRSRLSGSEVKLYVMVIDGAPLRDHVCRLCAHLRLRLRDISRKAVAGP